MLCLQLASVGHIQGGGRVIGAHSWTVQSDQTMNVGGRCQRQSACADASTFTPAPLFETPREP